MPPSPARPNRLFSVRRLLRLLASVVVLLGLAAGAAACGSGDGETESGGTVSDDGSSEDSSTSNGDEGDHGSDDDVSDNAMVDEAAARRTLNDLVAALATDDYSTAVTFLLNEGISEVVLVQLGIGEEEAFRAGGLEASLADYCQVNDCTLPVKVGKVIEAEFLTATFEVQVGPDGETEIVHIPVGAFEGRYTVAVLPFGQVPPSSTENAAADDDDDDGDDGGTDGDGSDDAGAAQDGDGRFLGSSSPEGWRLAPVAVDDDPVVTIWNGNGWMFPSHSGWPADALPSSPDIEPLSEVVNAASVIVYQRQGDERRIWLHHLDKADEVLVSVAEGEYVDLEGGRVLDLDDAVIFYTVRSGSMPENTEEVLHSMALTTRAERAIVTTGGWESGTRFTILDDAYPEVVGTWGAEGFLGQVIVDLEAGQVVYHADQAGYSCFDGEADCPAYDTAALVDGRIYGIRSEWNAAAEVVDTRSLFSFDPETGREQVVARFAWDNGLWYPRQIMALGGDLIVSVEDGDGEALPAVVVDRNTGQARTLKRAGFVGPAYLS